MYRRVARGWTICADNWLRTITSDRTVYNNLSLSFSFELVDIISLDRNYWDIINWLFVLPGLYLNIVKTEKILQFWRLTTCAGSRLRTITSDQTVYNNLSLSFSFELAGMMSLDRNYWEVINLLFVLPGLYLNILKTEKTLQFSNKEFSTCVARHSSASCYKPEAAKLLQ